MKKGRLLKTAAFLLASLMLLSACQSGGGASGKESSAAAGSSASQADTADKPEAWIADGVTLRLVRADNPSQPMTTDNLIIEEIKKRTGIEISVEAIPGADFAEKQKTMIMTNNMPDILYDTYDVPDYAPNGVFAPVSDYLDVMPNFSALLEATPEFKKLYIGDKLYYLPVMGRDIYRFGRSPMIRQDYLDETGLETPKNFEELHAVLKAVKEKHPDVYPLANRNGTGNLMTCFAYSMGSGYDVYFDPDVDGGKYVYGQANESFVPVMQCLADLYADGLLDPDYAVATAAQWQEKLAAGRSAFFFDNPSFAVNFNQALATTDSNAKFAPLEIPEYATGKRRGQFYDKNDRGATTISAASEHVEEAMKLMDYLYSDEGCNLTNFGVEGQQYDLQGGQPALRQEVVEEFSAQTDPIRAFWGSIGGGKLGLARYIDERAQEVFLDDEMKGWYNTWASWDFMGEMVIDPPFTEEENEELKEIKTQINTILEASYDEFIMGNRPMSEFADVQQQIKDAGALRAEEIYNAALARVQ